MVKVPRMKFTAWNIFSFWIMIIGSSEKATSRGTCTQTPCSGGTNTDSADLSLDCKSSSIMIADVRDSVLGHRNRTVLDAVRRICMGQPYCHLEDKLCPRHSNLVVHYECVDDGQLTENNCQSEPDNEIRRTSGHIRNEGYPTNTNKPKRHKGDYLCHWKIRPPSNYQVVINILDILTSGSNEDCDAGLVISGNSCKGQDPASSNLCSREAGKKLVHCSNVDIKLRISTVVFPLRFWLYYQMHPINNSSAQESGLTCLEIGKSQEGSSSSKGTNSAPGPGKKPSLTDILIILLSIISGISIVLFIILIVFCIRWRSLQLQGSEPLYNYQDISPGLQAHYEYISSLEPELDKNRPELVDGYFEVADALPALERGATPTSPAYAEVEQVAQMRRLIFSDEPQSFQTDSPDGTYSLVTSGLGVPVARHDKTIIVYEDGGKKDGVYNEPNSQNSSLSDIPSKSAGARPKRTVLERLKGVPGIAFGDKDKKLGFPGDVSPKLYNSRTSNTPSARSVLKGKTSGPSSARQKIGRLFGSREDVASRDIPDTTSEAGSEPAYETVEDFVPVSVSKHGMKAKLNTDNHQEGPVTPVTGPLPGGKQKWPNQKAGTKQQDYQMYNPVSQSTCQKGQLEMKMEKLPTDKKERYNFLNNQKSKLASSPKSTKPKSAKPSSTIPPHNESRAAIDKEKKFSNKGSAAAASPKAFFPGSKAEIKNKNNSSLLSDLSGTKNNNYKPTGLKDLPCSKGIVRNGIQKFEQSSSTSNE